MAIQQTKKQSDLEKRLRLLRQQVYGKDSSDHNTARTSSERLTYQLRNEANQSSKSPIASGPIQSDITYLNQDLLKILLFSSIAISAQIILFVLTKNRILNLNFF